MFLLLLSKTFRRLVASVLLAAFLLVAGTAARVWWVARQDSHPRSDVILVLGASQFDGRPSAVFRARLDHAKDLYDRGVAPRVVTVGGGREGDRFTEAAAGARYLRDEGVADVVAVEEGSNTLTSLQAAKRTLDERHWTSAVLVTDPWHELRSRRMADDLGIDAASSPSRSGPAVATRGTQIRYVARETAAYLYYRIFHRSSDAGPRAV